MAGSGQLSGLTAGLTAVMLLHLSAGSQLSQATETRNDYTVFSHNKKVIVILNYLLSIIIYSFPVFFVPLDLHKGFKMSRK